MLRQADPNPILTHALAKIIFDYLSLRDLSLLSDPTTYGPFTSETVRLVKDRALKHLEIEKKLHEKELKIIQDSEAFKKEKTSDPNILDQDALRNIVRNYLIEKNSRPIPPYIKDVLTCLARFEAFRGDLIAMPANGKLYNTLGYLGLLHAKACRLFALDVAQEILNIHLTIWPVNFRIGYNDSYTSIPLTAMSHCLFPYFKTLCEANKEEWSQPYTELEQCQYTPFTWLQEAILFAIKHNNSPDLRIEGLIDILRMSQGEYKAKLLATSKLMMDYFKKFIKSRESFFNTTPVRPNFNYALGFSKITFCGIDFFPGMYQHSHAKLTLEELNEIEKKTDEIEAKHFDEIYGCVDLDDENYFDRSRIAGFFKETILKTFEKKAQEFIPKKIAEANSLITLNDLYQQYFNKPYAGPDKTKKFSITHYPPVDFLLLIQKRALEVVLAKKPHKDASFVDYADLVLGVLQGPLIGLPDAKNNTQHEILGVKKDFRLAFENELLTAHSEILKNKMAKGEMHPHPKLHAYLITYSDLPDDTPEVAKNTIKNLILAAARQIKIQKPAAPESKSDEKQTPPLEESLFRFFTPAPDDSKEEKKAGPAPRINV